MERARADNGEVQARELMRVNYRVARVPEFQGRKRLNLVTYFWGAKSALDAWWLKNNGADLAAVLNSPEPVSSTRDGVSAPFESSVPPRTPCSATQTGGRTLEQGSRSCC